jgi:putative ABC transport system ATP-binding protein
MSTIEIITTQNLRKVYGMGEIEVKALDGVDIHINRGEFIAIMGPSGSGKSTLMNILGCLDRPTEGRYILAGTDVSQMNKAQLAAVRNQQLGFVFQSFNLLSRTSALNNVVLPLVYRRAHDGGKALSGKERKELAMAALETVGLADRADHEPMELSGGQRQRVAIARALVNDPALILADEPTGNLDTRTGEEILSVLHELHNRDRTILIVTHEAYIAEQTQRTIQLLDGKIAHIKENGSE